MARQIGYQWEPEDGDAVFAGGKPGKIEDASAATYTGDDEWDIECIIEDANEEDNPIYLLRWNAEAQRWEDSA